MIHKYRRIASIEAEQFDGSIGIWFPGINWSGVELEEVEGDE